MGTGTKFCEIGASPPDSSSAVSERLAPLLPKDRVAIGESGLFAPADLTRLRRVGITTR